MSEWIGIKFQYLVRSFSRKLKSERVFVLKNLIVVLMLAQLLFVTAVEHASFDNVRGERYIHFHEIVHLSVINRCATVITYMNVFRTFVWP